MGDGFRVGFTADFWRPDGSSAFGDVAIDLLDEAGVAWEAIPDRGKALPGSDVAGYDGIAVLAKTVTAETLENAPRLTIVARYGVGYDTVDGEACTRHGVLLVITPEGVRRPMATVNLAYLLALSHRLLEQDRFTRAGGWARKSEYMGTGLTGRTLGVIGFGNIAREFLTIAKPLGMRQISHDPYANPDLARELGVELVDLDRLMRESDFVVVACALTPDTRHLVNAERIAMMKPSAYLISTARGPIVDQAALTEALRERRIRGAGLDVFEQEPVDPDDPILKLDNVIVSPHGLALTDEWARITGEVALGAILDVRAGRMPGNIVNREVIDSPLLKAKLDRYREAAK
ncbi:MAG: hydroxyacid dehydrogenase [Chloroflexota bacterium]